MTAVPWDIPTPPPDVEGTDMPRIEERRQDAAKLSVPIQMTIAIAGTALALGGVFYQVTGGIRSDMRVLLEKVDSASEISRLRDDTMRSQLEAMKEEIKSLRGKSDLLQIQQQQLQLELAKGNR